jgi:hypothetical protein
MRPTDENQIVKNLTGFNRLPVTYPRPDRLLEYMWKKYRVPVTDY